MLVQENMLCLIYLGVLEAQVDQEGRVGLFVLMLH